MNTNEHAISSAILNGVATPNGMTVGGVAALNGVLAHDRSAAHDGAALNAATALDAAKTMAFAGGAGFGGEKLSPEIEALFWAARQNPSPRAQARLRYLLSGESGRLDWHRLTAMAGGQGVLPLLYCNARTLNVVPASTLANWRGVFMLGAARGLSLTRELIAIMELMGERNIPVVPYKGPVVAQAAYNNIAMRWFCDLDVLVHERDLESVQRLLLARGYEQRFHATDDRDEYAHKYVSETATIEVHWAILPRHYASPLHLETMWSRLRPIPFAGREVLAPSPEDLLLLLCLHGYKHRWNRLEWIACLAELTRPGQPMEWPVVLRRATQTGSRRMVLLGLQLAHELLEANLPPLVLRALSNDQSVPALAEASRNALLQAMRSHEKTPESAETSERLSFYHLKARERMRDKLRYLAGFGLVPWQIDWKAWLHAR